MILHVSSVEREETKDLNGGADWRAWHVAEGRGQDRKKKDRLEVTELKEKKR
jgi:acyl-CoA-binding protein